MENILKFIAENKLIKKGNVIGVGVSGGSDSMALLHFLKEHQHDLDFEVVAITIDHSIREEAAADVRFVMEYCRENHIRAYKFKVDAPKISKEKGVSLETAARQARYGIFEALIEKNVIDRVALAHHKMDQAETILMHILRGSGANGVRGMEARNGNYIRPMLTTDKSEVMDYVMANSVDYVTDKTNDDDTYSRNFVRNKVLLPLTKKWPGAVGSILNFSKSIIEDDNYINTQVFEDALIYEGKNVRIPLSYFMYHNAVVSRMIFGALKKIGVEEDIERKHIDMIIKLAREGENGNKINLPKSVSIYREYDYITISNQFREKQTLDLSFRCGSFPIANFGTLVVKNIKNSEIPKEALIVDADAIPRKARWRFRQEGDMFTKFGSGTKKLKSFFVDKKIPLRLRDDIPVLAVGNEILIVAGYEIAFNVKVSKKTESAYLIAVKK